MVMKSQCLICYSTSSKSKSNPDGNEETIKENDDEMFDRDRDVDRELIENRQFILRTFCSSFEIPLPLILTSIHDTNLKDNVIVQWNFEKENLPFCPSCERIAENLVELCQQLDTIKHEIEITKSRIRSEILKSNDILNKTNKTANENPNADGKTVDDSASNVEQDECISMSIKDETSPERFKKLTTKSSPKTKTCGRAKNKVEILRDLIVGPTLRLHRCTVLPQNEDNLSPIKTVPTEIQIPESIITDLNLKNETVFTNILCQNYEHNTIFNESEIDNAEDQGQVIDNDNLHHNDNVYSSIIDTEVDYDVDTEIAEVGGLTKKAIDSVNNHTETIFSNQAEAASNNKSALTQEFQILPSFKLRNRLKEYSNVNDDDEIDDDTDEDEDSYESSDDPEDDDFTLSDDDSEEEMPKRNSKANSKHKSKCENQVGEKIKSKLKAESQSRSKPRKSKDLNNPFQARKNRKTVRCEGDRYLYGDQFEFIGNDQDGFRCTLCPLVKYSDINCVRTHIRAIHDPVQGTILCPLCGRLFKTPGGLDAHMIIHKEKQILCRICGEKFRTETLLKTHMSNVHMDKTVICEYCGKICSDKRRAKIHVESVHMKEKRYFCEQCGKGFYGKTSLINHISSHTNERPFDCHFCSQKFTRYCHRQRHEKQFHGYLNQSKMSSTTGSGSDSNAKDGLISSLTTSTLTLTPKQQQRTKLDLDLSQNTQNLISDLPVATTMDVDVEEPLDPKKLSLKCEHCGLQYNRQNNLTRHLLQIHNINVKGLAWKSKYRRPQKQQSQIQASQSQPTSNSDTNNYSNPQNSAFLFPFSNPLPLPLPFS